MTTQEEWEEARAARIVTPERAKLAASRLIASHFRSTDRDHARMTIPINIDDDDVVIMDYISQTEAGNVAVGESSRAPEEKP